MKNMFVYCVSFNHNISNWNVSKVENMEAMFWRCYEFNQDISNWDVSKVKDMSSMFTSCEIEEKYKPKFK
jgi:surface protein